MTPTTVPHQIRLAEARRLLPPPQVDPDRMMTFESQARQYPRTGEPGLEHAVHIHRRFPDAPIDCLLWRHDDGSLIGVLNHYLADMFPYEKAGNVNLWVSPAHRRQGVGATLLRGVLRRRPQVDLRRQMYTPQGRELAAWVLATSGRGFPESDSR